MKGMLTPTLVVFAIVLVPIWGAVALASVEIWSWVFNDPEPGLRKIVPAVLGMTAFTLWVRKIA